jgi:hypothetical protein
MPVYSRENAQPSSKHSLPPAGTPAETSARSPRSAFMRMLGDSQSFRELLSKRWGVYKRGLTRGVLSSTRFMEAHPWLTFATLTTVLSWVALHEMAFRHLDHDELYTFYIANAASWRRTLELSQTVDLHPPLSYLLTRTVFHFLGASTFTARIPSIVAFIVASGLIFAFLSRISSVVFASVGLFFFWNSSLADYGRVARPYALLLMFSALLFFGWDRATDGRERRGWALAAVAAGTCGMVLSHVLALLPLAAFGLAELVRFAIRRKPDWKLWAAMLLPAISTVTYIPLFRTQGSLLYAQYYQPRPLRLLAFYWGSLSLALRPLLCILVMAVLWPVFSQDARADSGDEARKLTVPHRLLLLLLFLVPAGVGILFARSGTAFFDRYGIVILITLAVVPASLLSIRSRKSLFAGGIGFGIVVMFWFVQSFARPWVIESTASLLPLRVAAVVSALAIATPELPQPPPVLLPAYLSREERQAPKLKKIRSVFPELPMVAGSALSFMELDHYEDNTFTSRLFLLTNRAAAENITHFTVFEGYAQLKGLFPIRGTVAPYDQFIATHRHFLVLGDYCHPTEWLLRKLEGDGAQLKIIGTYQGTHEDNTLYEVTFRTPAPQPTASLLESTLHSKSD